MGVDSMTRRNTDSASLRVMIVGCGNIAGGFDEGCPPERPPYTHAGAYAGDGRFELLACVEPDEKRRVEFMSAWNVSTGFCSIEDGIGFRDSGGCNQYLFSNGLSCP
jgi:predicted dehydrogenase